MESRSQNRPGASANFAPLDWSPRSSSTSAASSDMRHRILYLDAYDSFSNNIVAQVRECCDVEIVTVKIDDSRFADDETSFREYLKEFDAAIAGPGPGWGNDPRDTGLIQRLWQSGSIDALPVLGICLGFQSLAVAWGASLDTLSEPRHGLTSEILHKGRSIFRGIDRLTTTQYHSLHVNIGHQIQTGRAVKYPGQLWKPSEKCPDLEPLAWDFDNRKNGAVLMGIKHVDLPFWGVQFHPESICTNEEGSRLIKNWWESAQLWNQKNRFRDVVKLTTLREPAYVHSPARAFSSPSPLEAKTTLSKGIAKLPALDLATLTDWKNPAYAKTHDASTIANLIAHGDAKTIPDLPPEIVHCATTGSGRLAVSDVCELFDLQHNEAIVLESGLQADLIPLKVGTGRYSIIGLIIPGETLRIHYCADSGLLQLRDGHDKVYLETEVSDVWSYIKAIMQHLRPRETPKGPTFAPFWGGLMGYASYEAGLETIAVSPSPWAEEQNRHPDVCYAYITRSIVFDHEVKKIYVQSIRGKDDMGWVNDSLERIYQAVGMKSLSSTPSPTPRADPFDDDDTLNQYIKSCNLWYPSQEHYEHAVENAKHHICDGQSYELCLTHQNDLPAELPASCTAPTARNELSWKLYKKLSKQNPAPFSAYLRIHNVHILSSSPERYISWDRNGSAQCRPIKGTVKKEPGVTRAHAEAILSSEKEQAENLMIVDLVRHQLHGVYGAGNVFVRQLMQIEEYESVYQLVSVIDAVPPGIKKARTPEEWEDPVDFLSIKREKRSDDAELGFDAFVQSLPPGSMTGAPKKRSCQLLKDLESNVRRGIYSGVIGYFDVGGGGDWNVVIRTAVKVDASSAQQQKYDEAIVDRQVDVQIEMMKGNEEFAEQHEVRKAKTRDDERWTIGAGGAITALSSPSSEYAEMLTKLNSTSVALTQPFPTPPQPSGSTARAGDPWTTPADLEAMRNIRAWFEQREGAWHTMTFDEQE